MKIIKRELDEMNAMPEYRLDKYHTYKVETGLYSEKATKKIEEFLHFNHRWSDREWDDASVEFGLDHLKDILWSFEHGVNSQNVPESQMYSALKFDKRTTHNHYNYVTKDNNGQIIFYFSVDPYDYMFDINDAKKRLDDMFNLRRFVFRKNKKTLRSLEQLHIMLFGKSVDDDIPNFNEESYRGVPFNPVQSGCFIQLKTEHDKLLKGLYSYTHSLRNQDEFLVKELVIKINETYTQMMTL